MKRKQRTLLRPAALLLAGLFFIADAGPAFAERRPPIGSRTPLAAAKAPAAVVERPQMNLQVSVRTNAEGLPSSVSGTLSVRDWKTSGAPHCLYLPYQDSDYGLDRSITRRQEMFADKYGRQVFEGGFSTVQNFGAPLLPSGAFLRLEPLVQTVGDTQFDDLSLTFESRVPRLAGTDADEWFFDGYMPRLLQSCPDDSVMAVRDVPPVAADITYTIATPDSWDFVGPGVLTPNGNGVTGKFTASHLAFALTRGQQRLATEIAGIHVDFVFKTQQFLQIIPTVEKTLPLLVQMFGAYPFNQSITIVETSELQRAGLPGLIAVNRAQQGLFNRLQSDWLNWMHWIVVSQLVKQWYGGAIVAQTPDDEWLIAGIAEAAILDVLSRDSQRFNLFAEYAPGVRLLSLTFLQVSELTAAILRRTAPFATLTSYDFRASERQRLQSPLLFVKHAEAMRQMKGLAGEQAFSGFMRQLTANYLHRPLSPADFYAFLARRPSPFSPSTRDQLQDNLKQWWMLQGWPDFKLEQFKKEALPNGHWIADVTASQQGGIDFAPLFTVEDESGKTYTVRAEAKQLDGPDKTKLWHAAIPMAYPPLRADVDQAHEAFDFDRFNNSSEAPGVQFFPGGAETLKDDAYTVVWVPYVYRLPAQPLSIGIQGASFRYIAQALFIKMEVAPKEKLGGGELKKKIIFEDRGVQIDLNLTQDYDNDRQMEAGISRSPLWKGEPQADIAVRTRFKQRLGITDSRHQTFVLAGSLKKGSIFGSCNTALTGEFEKTPPKFAKGFEYDRSLAGWTGDCGLSPRTSINSRIFYGMLRSTGDVPDQALFKPTDLREARLRIDESGLALVRRIASVGTDLQLPFYLPLPTATMIQTRQLRWRLFYDYGRSFEDVHEYRSSGLGFLLPFGGDLAGAGSLSVTKLTMLAILYSNVDGVASRKPSIVFDLSGDL